MRVHQLVAAACFIASMASACLATDGVEGTTVRPKQEDAKVTGCKIAAPDSYDVAVGALIELDYTYPVVPGAIPKKANAKTTSGAVVKSSSSFGKWPRRSWWGRARSHSTSTPRKKETTR